MSGSAVTVTLKIRNDHKFAAFQDLLLQVQRIADSMPAETTLQEVVDALLTSAIDLRYVIPSGPKSNGD